MNSQLEFYLLFEFLSYCPTFRLFQLTMDQRITEISLDLINVGVYALFCSIIICTNKYAFCVIREGEQQAHISGALARLWKVVQPKVKWRPELVIQFS